MPFDARVTHCSAPSRRPLGTSKRWSVVRSVEKPLNRNATSERPSGEKRRRSPYWPSVSEQPGEHPMGSGVHEERMLDRRRRAPRRRG